MPSYRTVRREAVPEPRLRHVIADYKHRAQRVICVCGWQGSTATTPGQPSEWNAHVAANRT